MILRSIVLVALGSFVSLSSHANDASLTGREIIDRYSAAQAAESELAFIAMTISRPGMPKREHRFLAAYRREADGTKKALVRLVRPKDVEGVSLLAHQDVQGKVETHVYMPALGQVSRLSGAALEKPFLGSDYSYKDLLAEAPAAHRYERLKDTTLRGVDCYQVRAIESEQRPDRICAYRELLIDKEKLRLMRVTFHAADGKLLKTFMPHDYDSSKVKGETTRPRRAVMVKPDLDVWTEFVILESRINKDIPAEIFTTKRIESWKPEDVSEFIFQFGFTVSGTVAE